MTVEQQEKQILALIYKLPLLRRIRLALTVLQGVEPETVTLKNPEWESEDFFKELDKRYEAMVNGDDEGISPEQLFQEIEQKLT